MWSSSPFRVKTPTTGGPLSGAHVNWTYSGTHLGSTPDREPTGKRAEWRAFSDYRFEDGVIVEATQIHDTYEQFLQLGLIEPPT